MKTEICRLLSRVQVNNWSVLPIFKYFTSLHKKPTAQHTPSLTAKTIFVYQILSGPTLQKKIHDQANHCWTLPLSKDKLQVPCIKNIEMEVSKDIVKSKEDPPVKPSGLGECKEAEIQDEKTVEDVAEVESTKTRGVLLQQENDLFEYRKQQRERWRKSQANDEVQASPESSTDIIVHTEDKVEKKKQSRQRELKKIGSSPRKKHREKRRHKSSESENVDKKRRSYETKQNVRDVESPVIIDLDPVCISEPRCTAISASGRDIIKVVDMDLASTDEEDIVMLGPEPRPGTSSDKPLSDDQKDDQDNDDDVLYMGTVINLTESTTSPNQQALAPTSAQNANSDSLPSCSYTSRPQQNAPLPLSNSGYVFSSSSSSMSYSTASAHFNTYSSSFSSFMSAASAGNAIRPTSPHGPPTVRHPGGATSWASSWPHPSAASGQPSSQFHQSTESRAYYRGPSHSEHRPHSSYKRGKNKKTKKSRLRNRSWVSVSDAPQTSANTMDVTVASYNLLAQNLLENNQYLYQDCDSRHLDWSYRSTNLLQEIQEYSPDILCLQEVKHDHYDDFFKPRLESIGYRGCYKRRTGDMEDGCATFYKDHKFELDVVRPLEYFTRGSNVLDRDNVALLVRLIPRDKHTSSKLVVANTHLLFNPKRGDVKLAQLVLLLSELDRLAHVEDHGVSPFAPIYHPTVLMGDFNSEPRSLLYQFLSTGRVDYLGQRINSFSGQEEGIRSPGYKNFGREVIPKSLEITDSCQYKEHVRSRLQRWEEATKGKVPERSGSQQDGNLNDNKKNLPHSDLYRQSTGTLQTFLPLVSVYKHWSFCPHSRRREREVTTHHGRSRCTVDYIFYAAGARVGWQKGSVSEPQTQLQLVKRLELLTDSQMEQLGPLPNRDVSSDHILIAARFQLRL